MSFPSFLSPLWGLLGLIAIPLIVLYLLRQKRPDLEISSTLLWSKALADMRASTPFQKLRRNLLLLLQLLILAALVLTLMRPVIQAHANQSKAGVIVIDATASMQTRDGGAPDNPGAMTRLDRAKEEAKKLVDAMRPGDRYMLIVDGGGLNHGGIGFTSSKSDLKAEIDKIRSTDTPSDLSESLILAASSLKSIAGNNPEPTSPNRNDFVPPTAPGKIWLFSDGAGIRVPDTMGENADLLQFVKIGASDHSVGITRLSITPVAGEPRTYEVFVGLKNAWDIEKKIGVVLAYHTPDNFLPGQAQFVTLPPNGQGGTVFEKVVADPGKLFVRIDDTDDDFSLDNTAYGLLEPARKVRVVLVTPGNTYLENFMKTAVKIGAIDGQIIAPAAYASNIQADLFIFDAFAPPAAQLPKADALLVRPAVDGAGEVGGFRVTATIDNPVILRWKREDPVMQAMELADLHISKALLLDKDPELVELVSAPEAPLIAYKDFGGGGGRGGGGTRRYFVTFSPLRESNWYMLPSQLMFLQNIIDQTRLRHYIGIPQLLATGNPAKLWDIGDEKTGAGPVRIAAPDGAVVQVEAKDFSAEFAGTDRVGFYTVTAGGKQTLFAANLLSSTESDIRPQSLQVGTVDGPKQVEESPSVAAVNKEIWPWLAAAGLVVLMLEWWVYHRRIA